ncbi:MAG TPA: ATP-binding protein, partial [Candidatus Bathyarchaeia archaeon]|nr:ATP-binding protein [Candidatus Bathyarchaeia archaeon]
QLAKARSGIRFSTKGAVETTGHGMGLMAARDIVERNGGTMTIDSVEGQGTTFSITLPLKKTDAPKTQSADGAMLTNAQARTLIERVYSEEKLRTVLVDSPKHIKYSIDDLVAIWQPFLSQVMNESGMDAAVFLEKAAQGDLPAEVQERLKAVFDRKNEMSHDQEEIGFRPDFFRRYVTEKINGIFDHQKEKRVKILLGGSLELEASYVLKVVGGIFEKACHDRGLNVEEEKKNWQISLVGYSIDSQGLLRTLTAIRWKLFEEWLRLEYMDLVDEKQNKRIIDEKPDIIICSRSLYLGHTTSFYDIVTVPYAKQYPGDRSKGKNQLEARRRFMEVAYQSLPDDGVLLSEEPWVFQPASVYAPFHYVDLPSQDWGLGSGIFLKSTGGNPTASSIIDELRRESKRTPVAEIQDWLIGGTHDYHWDPADAYQLVGLKEKGADATGMISYDIFIQDFWAPDHRGASVGSLEVGLEWLDDHDEKMRMRVAVSDQVDVHMKTFLHSFVKQVELKLSSGSVIELHSETEMETAAGDAQGLKRLFSENWLYDVEVITEPLGDGKVEVVVKGTVDKSRIERETDFGGDEVSEAVPAGSPATVSGTKDSAMLVTVEFDKKKKTASWNGTPMRFVGEGGIKMVFERELPDGSTRAVSFLKFP